MKEERIVEIKEFVCPFCDTREVIKIKDTIVSEEGKMGFGVDGWECKKCGAENDIFEDSCFSELSEMTEERLSNLDDFDIVVLFQFASHLVQKREFEKAARIMRYILEQDPKYYECKELLRRTENKLKGKNNEFHK